jgi:uncharacterized membrane protein
MLIYLDVLTALSLALLTGTEFAVSAFINPLLWRLEDRCQAFAVKALAAQLGTIMPFWYGFSLLLLAAEAWLRRSSPGAPFLWAAIAIWALTILTTIFFLVPINDRLRKVETVSFGTADKIAHRQWDRRHRMRIAALVIAYLLFILALVNA